MTRPSLALTKSAPSLALAVDAVSGNRIPQLSFEVVRAADGSVLLFGSVGPLAMAAIAGGAFAKYIEKARWPEIPVSLHDSARATSAYLRGPAHMRMTVLRGRATRPA